MNDHVRKTPEDGKSGGCGLLNRGKKRQHYNDYSAKERADIGRYVIENGATKAGRHYSKILGKTVLEATARRLKAEYLSTLKTEVAKFTDQPPPGVWLTVAVLPKKNIWKTTPSWLRA